MILGDPIRFKDEGLTSDMTHHVDKSLSTEDSSNQNECRSIDSFLLR